MRRMLALAAALAAAATLVLGCERYDTLTVVPDGARRIQYLVDFEHVEDTEQLIASGGYLLVLNPGAHPVPLDVTLYFEDRDPEHFALEARPGTTTWWPVREWPIVPHGRFALAVASSEPVIAQATLAWDNARGSYETGAETRSPKGVREAATSYVAIPALADRWFLPDGIVIDSPKAYWIRESEWTIVLNPGDEPADVTIGTFYRWFTRHHGVTVPPRRVTAVRMDDIVLENRHYGVRVSSDRPVAVHTHRTVYWYDSPEVMTFWSTPFAPLSAR